MLEAIAQAGHNGARTVSIAPGWFGRRFIAKMEPTAGTKYRSAKKVAPGGGGEAQAALQDFEESHKEVRRVIASWENVDLNRVCFKNPLSRSSDLPLKLN
jgi:hypothetical protein